MNATEHHTVGARDVDGHHAVFSDGGRAAEDLTEALGRQRSRGMRRRLLQQRGACREDHRVHVTGKPQRVADLPDMDEPHHRGDVVEVVVLSLEHHAARAHAA